MWLCFSGNKAVITLQTLNVANDNFNVSHRSIIGKPQTQSGFRLLDRE